MNFADTTVVIAVALGCLKKVTKRAPVGATDHENGEGDVSVMMRMVSELKHIPSSSTWFLFFLGAVSRSCLGGQGAYPQS